MYNKIYNPIINKFVDINSSSGKKLLVNYLNQLGAGKVPRNTKEPNLSSVSRHSTPATNIIRKHIKNQEPKTTRQRKTTYRVTDIVDSENTFGINTLNNNDFKGIQLNDILHSFTKDVTDKLLENLSTNNINISQFLDFAYRDIINENAPVWEMFINNEYFRTKIIKTIIFIAQHEFNTTDKENINLSNFFNEHMVTYLIKITDNSNSNTKNNVPIQRGGADKYVIGTNMIKVLDTTHQVNDWIQNNWLVVLTPTIIKKFNELISLDVVVKSVIAESMGAQVFNGIWANIMWNTPDSITTLLLGASKFSGITYYFICKTISELIHKCIIQLNSDSIDIEVLCECILNGIQLIGLLTTSSVTTIIKIITTLCPIITLGDINLENSDICNSIISN